MDVIKAIEDYDYYNHRAHRSHSSRSEWEAWRRKAVSEWGLNPAILGEREEGEQK